MTTPSMHAGPGPLSLPLPLLDRVLTAALEEDLAGGDLTSEACVDPDVRASARAVARRALVVAGGVVFARVFSLVDPTAAVELALADGTKAEPNAVLWRVGGSARSLLAAERTALNVVQRMSGTATLARRYVDAIPAGCKTRITDTRKTTPGLRALERYAVRAGGASNHRDDLGSAVLIKDNHIVAAGGVAAAVGRARARAPHTSRVEVEVTTLEQLEEALSAGAEVIMLDNFAIDAVRAAVRRVHEIGERRPLIEVSGGITLERIPELCSAGVDVISVGALTHSAPAADIALDFDP